MPVLVKTVRVDGWQFGGWLSNLGSFVWSIADIAARWQSGWVFADDQVDSQRGEVEWDGGNLHYDQWSYEAWTRAESWTSTSPAS